MEHYLLCIHRSAACLYLYLYHLRVVFIVVPSGWQFHIHYKPYFWNACSLSYPFQSMLEEIAPTWVNVSLRMKDDLETDKAFGWVLEMWVLSLNYKLALVWCVVKWSWVVFYLMLVSFLCWTKVCICCGICIAWRAAYSSWRLYVAGLNDYFLFYMF